VLTTVATVMTDETSAARDLVDEGDLKRIGDEFGLGDVRNVAFLVDGIMNRNWRIETAAGVYALKLLRDVPPETARRSATVLAALASAGLPVCAPVSTRDGEFLLQIGPRAYLVAPWAAGAHIEGTSLPLGEVTDFGVLVATIHQTLGDHARVPLPAADVRPRVKVTGPDTALGKADRLLSVISGLTAPDEFDDRARDLLERRKVLIEGHRASMPAEGHAAGPFGWTHGDLQYRNVLWSGGKVSAVLDWDRVAIKTLGEEVARTAQVQFGGEHGHLDLERVAAFVTGYRSVIPLSRADLTDAVHRLWWKRMSDYWIFEVPPVARTPTVRSLAGV
jgi:Ser/Thr protein kinase RdoA (MazF antagonist)